MQHKGMFGFAARLLAGIGFSMVLTDTLYAESSEERGREIAVEMDRRDIGFSDYRADVTMTLANRAGRERMLELVIEALENREEGERSLISLRSPRDIAGTALLTYSNLDREDDQWLFLPAVSRVRRISSSNRAGAFMGSEFSYEDLIRQDVDKFTYNYIDTQDCDADSCFVIERFPVSDNSGYSRQILWIDTDEYRQRQVVYYDRAGNKLKTLTYSGYEQHAGSYWRANRMLMENHRNGHTTDLEWRDYEFQSGLSEVDFTVSRLRRAR